MSTPSAPQSITAVTLKVTSAGTPSTVSQTFNDTTTLASLKVGITNSLRITNQEILGRYATPGLQCSNMLSVEYTGYMDVNSVTVSTPALVSNFVATPITLSNFGPFTYNFVSGSTFTLPQPTSNSNSPGTFSYSVNGTTGIVSITGNVVTMLAPGSTTIRAIQNAAGGYASSTPIDATVNIVSVDYNFLQLGKDIDGELPYDNSGYSVSLSKDGTIVAIGAILNDGNGNDGNGTDSGQVRVYQYDALKTVAQPNQNHPNFGPVGWNRLGGDIDGEAANDWSGISVSLSKDNDVIRVAIGGRYNDDNGTDSGHVRVYQYDALKTVAQPNQNHPNFGPVGWNRLGGDLDGEAANDYSGISVSLSADGTRVAIGAYGNDGNGNNSGQVRVYQYDALKTVAQPDQKLPNFGPVGWNRLGGDIDGEAANDWSGVSVSLSSDGNRVAIGGRYNDGNSSNDINPGHVRVYQYDASKTVAQPNQNLPNFGPVGWNRLGGDIDGELPFDNSGVSVSLSSDGTRVAIGARYNDGNNGNDVDSGQVRVYQYDALKTVAQPNQNLPNFGPVGWNRLGGDIDGEAANDWSGISVSLSKDGNRVAIGAHGNDGNGNNSGYVRVYQYDALKTVAQPNQTLPNFGPVGWNRLGQDIDGEAANDWSGWSVSLSGDGNRVAIGAILNDGNDVDSGQVRVYQYTPVPTFGPFTLPNDISVYKNQIITRVLTPPTSNSSGSFSYTSSNNAVATITSNNSGVYSINIIGPGSTQITVTQDASGIFGPLSTTAELVVTLLYPSLGPFILQPGLIYDITQTITRVLTPPTSNSYGSFSYTSSNNAVATITNDNGVYSINVISAGISVITAIQAGSGEYSTTSISVLLNTATGVVSALVSGFTQISSNNLTDLDFNSGMTTLFSNADDEVYGIIIPNAPNSNFRFNNKPYNALYIGSNCWFSFDKYISEPLYPGVSSLMLTPNIYRIFTHDAVSACYYKFTPDNTRLLVKMIGNDFTYPQKTFTITIVIDQLGCIITNYTLSSTYNSDPMVIGFIGNDTSSTTDDIFLNLNGVTFNGIGNQNLYSLLNGKTILYYTTY